MFDLVGAIVAGLIGGAAMGLLLYLGIWMAPAQMRMNLFLMLGTMVFRPGAMAYGAGFMMHAVMSIVFGLIHAAAFVAFGLEANAAWGLGFGAVHWLVVGMGLGMIPIMHARMRSGDIARPGFFALSMGAMTAAGFLMLHLLYGVLVGAIYGAWIS